MTQRDNGVVISLNMFMFFPDVNLFRNISAAFTLRTISLQHVLVEIIFSVKVLSLCQSIELYLQKIGMYLTSCATDIWTFETRVLVLS